MLLHRFLFVSLLALARAQEEEEGDAQSSSSVRPAQASGSAKSVPFYKLGTRADSVAIARQLPILQPRVLPLYLSLHYLLLLDSLEIVCIPHTAANAADAV